MIIFGDIRSGNCYKIKLLCELLDLPHEWRHKNILQGETRTEDFLHVNPNGKIPAVLLDNGQALWESNAILFFLAQDTAFLPGDAFLQAQILQWQFFEQYSHEPFIATSRFIQLYLGLPENRRQEYESKRDGGYKALGVMEQHLARHPYLVDNTYSIADITLFAYTHVAHEGGFDLSRFPAVRQWIARIEQHPKHFKMSDPM